MFKKALITLALVVPVVLMAMKINNQQSDQQEVTLQAQDGRELKVPYSLIRYSNTLVNLIEDAGTDAIIPLPNITSSLWAEIQTHLMMVDQMRSQLHQNILDSVKES